MARKPDSPLDDHASRYRLASARLASSGDTDPPAGGLADAPDGGAGAGASTGWRSAGALTGGVTLTGGVALPGAGSVGSGFASDKGRGRLATLRFAPGPVPGGLSPAAKAGPTGSSSSLRSAVAVDVFDGAASSLESD